MQFITEFYEEAGATFQFDDVKWILDEENSNGFNKNLVKENIVYSDNEDTRYMILNYQAAEYDGIPTSKESVYMVTKENFKRYLEEAGAGLFWIIEENGVVLECQEQYVP